MAHVPLFFNYPCGLFFTVPYTYTQISAAAEVAEKMSAAPERAPRRLLEFRNNNQECEFYTVALRSETCCSLLEIFIQRNIHCLSVS